MRTVPKADVSDKKKKKQDETDPEFYGFTFDGIVPQLADSSCFCWGCGGKERPHCPVQTAVNLCLKLYSVYDSVVQGVNSPSAIAMMLFLQKPQLMLHNFRAVNAQLLNNLTLDPVHLIGTNLTFLVKYQNKSAAVTN